MLAEYKEVFLEELEEQLQLMDEVILKLEREGDSGSVVQSLFRAAHTLKGSSAAMGFEEMKQLTHHMEHLLDQVRGKKRTVTPALIDLLFQSMDCLKQLKNDIEASDAPATDIGRIVKNLETFASTKEDEPLTVSVTGSETGSETLRPPLSLSDRLKIQEQQDAGHRVYWLQIGIVSDCVIQGARAYVIHSMLSEWGEVLLMTPDLESLEETLPGSLTLTFLYAGIQEEGEIRSLVTGLTDVACVTAELVEGNETAMAVTPAATGKAAAVEEASPAGKAKSQTIRVSVERLDHLMNLVGELVIDQTRIHQVERNQRRRFQDDTVSELGHISDHLSRIIGDLQESVMKARMLPIEQLFNRFPRMIRDLSRDLGKDLELVMEGQDTELDRTLIEEIADPLIHLIRNAVDHGLETPDVREQSGKPRKGTLRIRAAHEDNQVVIYVEDDGAGIDPAKMKASALKKGILTEEEAELLTDREAVDLIFRPGFSTAQTISDVSGRGVGMDIVRSHIEKLNGLIDIDTRLGRGTSFKIKLPLTLAIIVGLLVKVNGQTLIIPMSNIAEIVRVTNAEIQVVRGQSVITLRNQVIPIVSVHDRFKGEFRREEHKHIPLVIVGSAEKRLALAVDDLIGNQEIVIKSLGSYIGKVDGIAGATILGDGSVALIFEISSLFHKAGAK
uniref:Chemotaxis protein CheA n=2 Tax=Cohnella candidum TaxID=2674991 RepID=A0A3G3K4R3_9BACL|nr:chemotaxis protein CheA [Cohnella candidum]AYQ75525.1 chemotaxis protein CheA [Cohnella candidum]